MTDENERKKKSQSKNKSSNFLKTFLSFRNI